MSYGNPEPYLQATTFPFPDWPFPVDLLYNKNIKVFTRLKYKACLRYMDNEFQTSNALYINQLTTSDSNRIHNYPRFYQRIIHSYLK
jgi:hypothetical protein